MGSGKKGSSPVRKLLHSLEHSLGKIKPLSTFHLLSGLIVFSLLLRLALPNHGALYAENILITNAIEESVTSGQLHVLTNGGSALIMIGTLFYTILHVLVPSLAIDTLVRVLCVILAVAAIPLLYSLGKSITGSKLVGFCAAFLLALSPLYYSQTTSALLVGPALFFTLLAAQCLLLAESRDSDVLRTLAVIILGFGILTKGSMILFIIPLLYLAFSRRKIKDIRNLIRLFYIIFPFAFILWIVYFIEGIRLDSLLSELTALSYSLRTSLFGLQALTVSATIIGSALAVWGVYSVIKAKQHNLLIFLALWLVPPFIFIFGAQEFSSALLVYPFAAFALFAGLGFKKLFAKSRSAAVFALLIITILMLSYSAPLMYHRHAHPASVTITEHIAAVTDSSAIILTQDDAPFVNELRSTVPVPADGNLENSIYPLMQSIKNAIFSGNQVYITTAALEDDFEDTMQRGLLLNFNFKLVDAFVMEDTQKSTLFSIVKRERLYLIELNTFEDFERWNTYGKEKYYEEAAILDTLLLPGDITDYPQ